MIREDKKFKGSTYHISNEPIIISKSISDLFLSRKNPGDLLALYWFYYYTAKWQKTNQVKATVQYVVQGLGWSIQKVRQVRKDLKELHLIEDIQTRSKDGKVDGSYVLVKFIWGIAETSKISHPNDFPQGGSSHRVANPYINALSINNINALSINNKSILGFFEHFTIPESFHIIIHKWFVYKCLRKEMYTKDRSIKAFLTKLYKYSNKDPKTAMKVIKLAMDNNWVGIWPNESNQKFLKKKKINSDHILTAEDLLLQIKQESDKFRHTKIERFYQDLKDKIPNCDGFKLITNIIDLEKAIIDTRTFHKNKKDLIHPIDLIYEYIYWMNLNTWFTPSENNFKIDDKIFNKFCHAFVEQHNYIHPLTGKYAEN